MAAQIFNNLSHVDRAAITFPPQVASIVKLVGITIVRRRSKPGRYQQLNVILFRLIYGEAKKNY